MEETAFWQQKIYQFFHDPPAKPYASLPYQGGHTTVAKELFNRFTGEPQVFTYKPPDWAMSGADRPMLYIPKGAPGPVSVSWPSHPFVTHPLGADFLLDARPPGETGTPRAEVQERRELTNELLESERDIAADLGNPFSGWEDPARLQAGYISLWRRFRDALIERNDQPGNMPLGDLLWEEMPADSRSPDHSIWDHLKVTTALAFLKNHSSKKWHHLDEGARQPWLFCCSLGPTQRFIAESRTSRDLWISSYLLSDLSWHAMQPIVERYGPDCMVYPELRGNPRVDVWLHDAHREALADNANPMTFAAVLPNTFTALLPLGGNGHLEPLKNVAENVQQRVHQRWQELSDTVRDWLRPIAQNNHQWETIWQRQHERVIHTIWSAVPWLPMGELHSAESLRGRALPVQQPGFRQPAPDQVDQVTADLETLAARRDRLAPWVPKADWQRYEWAREVFAFSYLDFHQMERGFDYALTHHQLRTRHALRKSTAAENLEAHEPGEKCTVCGRRQALVGDNTGSPDGLDHSRAAARDFWRDDRLDPNRSGSERLCAVCTMKRFLIKADSSHSPGELGRFNGLWAGPASARADVMDRDGQVRVPFPAAATLASQDYLSDLVTSSQLEPLMADVVRAAQAANLDQTNFPRALPRLAEAQRRVLPNGAGERFLEYEAQDLLFPDAIKGKSRLLERDHRKTPQDRTREIARLDTLWQSVQRLRREADRLLQRQPNTRIAVIQLDGDHMGQLLLGSETAVGARWRDIIHPLAVEKIEQSGHLGQAGWGDLLDRKRLMGPSLHAFISRALANFSHRIVPWVVEMEFSGRLIYAGGDDVLCLAPGHEAIGLAARLQQLFSAPWVVDTAAHTQAWIWRHRDWDGSYDQALARQRFAILQRPPDTAATDRPHLRLPVTDAAYLEPHVAGSEMPSSLSVQGPIMPMLGSQASLSAGIAFAHFKTPMSLLLGQAQHLLEDVAKNPFKHQNREGQVQREHLWNGRRAVALSHYSRGGLKTEFAMPWSRGGEQIEAHEILGQVQTAFEKGRLASRLPYKLRDVASAAKYALDAIEAQPEGAAERDQRADALLAGLFNHCLDQSPRVETRLAYQLWRAGIHLYRDNPSRYSDGLLLCRALAEAEPDMGDELE